VWTTRSTFSKKAFVDNRVNLIVNVDSFLVCQNQVRIPASERHERDEVFPMDFQYSLYGVGLEFSIHVKDLFHDLCVFL